MEVFGDDFIIGDFMASNYGLNCCSFEYDGNAEDDIFGVETIEEFIGENPKSVYTGQKYSFHLEGTITLMKDPCQYKDLVLSEYECRAVLRQITGHRGYKWMRFITKEIGDEIWYKARVTKVSLKRVNGDVVGIIINIQTNSYLSYSKEFSYSVNFKKNQNLTIFINSDDLVNYDYPDVYIIPNESGTLKIEAVKDIPHGSNSPYLTQIENVIKSKEIHLDGVNKLVDGCSLNDFNLHWIRFLSGENIFKMNMDCDVKFVYRLTRKVGFICR